MKLRDHQRVTYDTAKERVLAFMEKRYQHDSRRRLYHASEVGRAIWPENEMRSQGLGAAASRILKRMEGEGLVKQGEDDDRTEWGWFKK